MIQACIVRLLSTTEAAKKLGVTRLTIQRHIAGGKITPPKLQKIGGSTMRLWSAKDIARVGREMRKSEKKG
jgi:excisionase family DNA binding protein